MTCTRCGHVLNSTRGEHLYTESGLSNVVLLNAEIRSCAACGAREVVVPRLEELHHLIGESVTALRPLRFVFSDGWKEVEALGS